MRILTNGSFLTAAILAGVFSPLAPAVAADLDDYPLPPPYYERGPVPPAFVPERVAPVVVRPVIYPRVVRPYGFYGPRPVVRVYGERAYGYGEPRDYGDAYSRPLPPRVGRDREEFGRDRYGYEHESFRHEHERDGGYGHYLSHEELDRRAERGHEDRDRFAERDGRGFGRDDRFAERRDFDR